MQLCKDQYVHVYMCICKLLKGSYVSTADIIQLTTCNRPPCIFCFTYFSIYMHTYAVYEQQLTKRVISIRKRCCKECKLVCEYFAYYPS